MYGSVEQMDVAEVLATIVERACLYVPEVPVGASNKRSNEAFSKVKFPKEEHTDSENVYPKEALTRVEKVPMVASNLVRFTSF